MKITKILSFILVFSLLFSSLVSCQEEHTHSFSREYSSDGTHHWYKCSCGETKDKAEHTFGEGVTVIFPTTESEGLKCFTCSVCGYKNNQPINKLESYDENTATTVLSTLDGEILDTLHTQAAANGLYEIILPEIAGYVPEYDKLIVSKEHGSINNTVYYSPISIWDGTSASSSLSGAGTKDDPYLIQSAADFAYLRGDDLDGKHFKLTVSIDLNEKNFTITDFGGILDGNHCSIRGIKIVGANNTGLLGTIKAGGRVSDLSLYGIVSGAETVGALAAVANGEVENVVNFASVSGTLYVGGVVGISNFSISGCVNYGELTANGRVGGIAYGASGTVEGSINYGAISGGWDLGGILGYIPKDSNLTVSECINYGRVAGTTGVGGILGYSEPGSVVSIEDCVNNGSIGATWGGGGIAGNTAAEIKTCVNNGVLNAEGELGGIVGKCYGLVTECTNNGDVTGTIDVIGGIVGNLHDTTHGKTIWTTNTQNGGVNGPGAQQIIGKGYIYSDEDPAVPGPLTEEEFLAQPSMYGSPWVDNETRMKILMKIRMTKGTTITFLGDEGVYCWGIMETTDKDNASNGAWKDTGWNTDWPDPSVKTYTTTYATGYFVITVARIDGAKLTATELGGIHAMFKVEGNKASDSASGSINNPWLDEDMVSINHRGWYQAPENTLSAYRESYNHGFKYVECDVQFTKDGVAVLLHDDTIDRTSDGSGAVSQLTYAELLQYDFSYDDKDTVNDFSAYRGEKIPTFEEFIELCKELELHPYIEIKGSLTDAQAKQLLGIVEAANMLKGVSWLSFSGDALARIADNCPGARLVWVLTDTYDAKIKQNNIPFAEANLMTGESEVVIDLYYTLVTQSIVDLLQSYNIPLEVWTVNDADKIRNLHPYVSGVTSDSCNAKEILSAAE